MRASPLIRFSVKSILTAASTAAFIVSLTSPALADDTGFYVGANVGRVLSSYHRADIDKTFTTISGGESGGFTLGPPSSVDKSHVTWSANVGYFLSRNFAVEASYLNLGSLRYSGYGTQVQGSTSTAIGVQLETKSHGPALALIGILPMSDIWEVHARFGAYQGKTLSTYSFSYGDTTSTGRQSQTSTSLLAGVGTAVTLSSHYQIRLDYIRLEHLKENVFKNSFNVDLLTVGAAYVF